MTLLRTLIWMSVLLLASGLQAQTAAQRRPTSGMLFSPSQPAALKYECNSTSESRVTCRFTELDVYKVRYPSVDETLGTSWASIDGARCAEASRELEESLKERPDAPAQPTSRMRNEQRRIDALKATVEYCLTGNREAWREYLTRERERQQKTCTLSAHSYVQTLHHDSVGSTSSTRWATEQQPYGECRIHREAQFTSNGDSWSYSARYKVTNKSGQRGQLRCEEIREQEVIYIASQNEEAGWADCETIPFEAGCYSPDFPCLGVPPVVVHCLDP
jgi:hypothetical protein